MITERVVSSGIVANFVSGVTTWVKSLQFRWTTRLQKPWLEDPAPIWEVRRRLSEAAAAIVLYLSRFQAEVKAPLIQVKAATQGILEAAMTRGRAGRALNEKTKAEVEKS